MVMVNGSAVLIVQCRLTCPSYGLGHGSSGLGNSLNSHSEAEEDLTSPSEPTQAAAQGTSSCLAAPRN